MVVVLVMTSPTPSETGTHALVRPVVLRGGRRRITHVSESLLKALTPYVRAGGDAERPWRLSSPSWRTPTQRVRAP
ncbi:hypothetical protein AB0K89_22965 [Streptomyces cinnamoneus]|uniref:hypothetical protein n=1 Tax=Streptomyces cinnamoneus TaxID=53446 RepID=UPI003443F6D1